MFLISYSCDRKKALFFWKKFLWPNELGCQNFDWKIVDFLILQSNMTNSKFLELIVCAKRYLRLSTEQIKSSWLYPKNFYPFNGKFSGTNSREFFSLQKKNVQFEVVLIDNFFWQSVKYMRRYDTLIFNTSSQLFLTRSFCNYEKYWILRRCFFVVMDVHQHSVFWTMSKNNLLS